jgi:hypothetical protein
MRPTTYQGKVKYIHGVAKMLQLDYRDLIEQYTGKRSIRMLTTMELEEMVKALLKAGIHQTQKGTDIKAQEAKPERAGNNQRRKLLSLGYDMEFHKPRTEAQKYMSASAINFENVNNWCKSKKCPVQKDMNEMDEKELNKAVTAFMKVKQSYFKKLNNEL